MKPKPRLRERYLKFIFEKERIKTVNDLHLIYSENKIEKKTKATKIGQSALAIWKKGEQFNLQITPYPDFNFRDSSNKKQIFASYFKKILIEIKLFSGSHLSNRLNVCFAYFK
ncbi:hypothetical protein [Pararhodonellum marinum]|uniref:hypothetical protein n=1 Tax=Pararhodonellum marinum TaxID=2755358 RepID=UPI00188DE98B|nr:hypothetical protein [Pararhodonellum marinum]